MATPLRILFVEDVDDDVTLVGAYLRRSGFAPTIERVENAAAMSAALAAGQWDVVLSDFSLPQFSAPAALRALHDSGQDLPFIIMSGTINEAMAVEALKAGAHDFIVKGNFARLVPAIEREMREAKNRAVHRQSEERFQTTLNTMLEGVQIIGFDWRYLYLNDSAAAQGHKPKEELLGQTMLHAYPGIEQTEMFATLRRCMTDRVTQRMENEFTYPDGSRGWFDLSIQPVADGLFILSSEITQRKQRERELEAVAAVSAALRTAQTLDDMLPVWLDVTLDVMRATGGSIWLYDAVKEELRPAATRGWIQPAGAGPVQPQKLNVGVNGFVFATGQPYVSANFHLDPHVAEAARSRIPPGGGVGIPIRVEDQVIGTFVVNVAVGREIKPDEVHLLTTLAEIAGSAIQRTQLFEQAQQRVSQLSALRAIDQAIIASMDLNLTLTVFLEHVLKQLGADAADVLLLDPLDQTLAFAAGRGFRTREFQQARTRVGEGRAGRAALERRIVVSDLHDEHVASKRTQQLVLENFVVYFGVPLIAKGQVLGVLEVFHRSPLAAGPEWLEFLAALASQAAIALDNAVLFTNLQRSNTDLQMAYDATIEGWSRALDLRDRETEGHSQRVTQVTERLAVAMGVADDRIVHLRRGALLHDIGKMGVPDHILLKPGPLTDDEWTAMRQHPTLAYQMLSPIQYLRQALEIPYCHHEKWDGTGYPRRLKGDQIPLAARIFAVVDVRDALHSDRPYRRAWPAERVREYLHEQSGKHFDPAVVEAFLKLEFSDGR